MNPDNKTNCRQSMMTLWVILFIAKKMSCATNDHCPFMFTHVEAKIWGIACAMYRHFSEKIVQVWPSPPVSSFVSCVKTHILQLNKNQNPHWSDIHISQHQPTNTHLFCDVSPWPSSMTYFLNFYRISEHVVYFHFLSFTRWFVLVIQPCVHENHNVSEHFL